MVLVALVSLSLVESSGWSGTVMQCVAFEKPRHMLRCILCDVLFQVACCLRCIMLHVAC